MVVGFAAGTVELVVVVDKVVLEDAGGAHASVGSVHVDVFFAGTAAPASAITACEVAFTSGR